MAIMSLDPTRDRPPTVDDALETRTQRNAERATAKASIGSDDACSVRVRAPYCQVAVSGLMLWARALASMVLRNQVARPGRMPS